MPRKTFAIGEVLTAANVNTYLSNEQLFTASTATAYTVQTADRYQLLDFTNAGTVTVTFGTATAFEAGERVDITWGTGVVNVVPGGGVTMTGRGTAGTAYTSALAYDGVTVFCTGSNAYRIIGNVTGA